MNLDVDPRDSVERIRDSTKVEHDPVKQPANNERLQRSSEFRASDQHMNRPNAFDRLASSSRTASERCVNEQGSCLRAGSGHDREYIRPDLQAQIDSNRATEDMIHWLAGKMLEHGVETAVDKIILTALKHIIKNSAEFVAGVAAGAFMYLIDPVETAGKEYDQISLPTPSPTPPGLPLIKP